MSEALAPHFSEDRRWWWDGQVWIPVPPPPPGSRTPEPERELLVRGLHPLPAMPYALGAPSVLLVAAGLAVLVLGGGVLVLLAGAGLAALLAAVTRIQVAATRIVVTNRRVVWTRGVLVRHDDAILIEKVESVSQTQGVLGRLLGYGTVQITGTGGSGRAFAGVRDPGLVRDVLTEQVGNLTRR